MFVSFNQVRHGVAPFFSVHDTLHRAREDYVRPQVEACTISLEILNVTVGADEIRLVVIASEIRKASELPRRNQLVS